MAYKINILEMDGHFEHNGKAHKSVKKFKLVQNNYGEIWTEGKHRFTRTKYTDKRDLLANGIKYARNVYKNVDYIDERGLKRYDVTDVIYEYDTHRIIQRTTKDLHGKSACLEQYLMEYEDGMKNPLTIFVGSSDRLAVFVFLSKKLNSRYPLRTVKDASQNPRTMN